MHTIDREIFIIEIFCRRSFLTKIKKKLYTLVNAMMYYVRSCVYDEN